MDVKFLTSITKPARPLPHLSTPFELEQQRELTLSAPVEEIGGGEVTFNPC